MRKGEKDYMAEVRRKWIADGWIHEKGETGTDVKQKLGKLCEKVSKGTASKIWDRVAYLAKVSAGIKPGNTASLTEEKEKRAREIAEAILGLIYQAIS